MQRNLFKSLRRVVLSRSYVLPQNPIISSVGYVAKPLFLLPSFKFSQTNNNKQNDNNSIKLEDLKRNAQLNKVIETHGKESIETANYLLRHSKVLFFSDLEESTKWLSLARKIYTQTKGEQCEEIAKTYELQAGIYTAKNELEKARETIEKERNIYLSMKDFHNYFRAKEDIAMTYFPDVKKAIAVLDEALNERKKQLGENDPWVSVCLIKIGVVETQSPSDPKEVSEFIEEVSTILKSVKATPAILAEFYTNLAYVYINLGRADKAISSMEEALKNLDSEKDFEKLGTTYHFLATLYQKTNNTEKAIENYTLELQEANKYEYPADPDSCYSLAKLYEGKKEFVKAAQSYEKISHVYREKVKSSKDKKDQETVITMLCKAGDIFRKENELEKAAIAYYEAFFYCTKYFGFESHHPLTMHVFQIIALDKDPHSTWYGQKWDSIRDILVKKRIIAA